jgi:hypothetical protein
MWNMIVSVQLEKKSGREFQRACRQDELIGITLRTELKESLEMAAESDSEEMARKELRCLKKTSCVLQLQ